MIISICNEKGGCGKTSVAVNLACRLADDGDKVVLVDTDPQQSTVVFTNNRALSELPALFSNICKTGAGLRDEIRLQNKNNDVVIIDTGGRDTIEMRIAISMADIVIVPTLPSIMDLEVLERMLDICAQAQATNEKLKILVLCNRLSPNPLLNKEIDEIKEFIAKCVKEKGIDAEVLESLIFERRIYKKIFEDGKTLLEYSQDKNNKAVLEFEEVFKEIVRIGGGEV